MPLFPNFRAWNMINVDTGEAVEGQFEPLTPVHTVKANYASHTALSRNKSILQFLTGENDTLTFQAFMFGETALDTIDEQVEQLKSWARPDPKTLRPPIIVFWVGDGHLYLECIIESVSTAYGRPTWAGGLRQATLSVSLREYKPFSLNDTGTFETRYHRAAERDYYEMLCHREYADPDLGDIIRKRHPSKPNIQTGDVIKLPSIEAIRRDVVTQESTALAGAYAKKDTPQRRLRLEMFEKRNRTYTSHVLVED